MAKVTAIIQGPWAVGGSTQLHADYPGVETISDITGQPAENVTPTPNTFLMRCVMDESVLDLIEADSTYYIHQWGYAPTETP